MCLLYIDMHGNVQVHSMRTQKNISIPLAEISCSVTGTVQDIATGLVHRKGKYFILFPGFDSIQQDFHSCGIMVMVIWMGPLSIQDHMH